jgi:hypothetical protein
MPRRQRTQPHLLRKRSESPARPRQVPPRALSVTETVMEPNTDATTSREAAIAEALANPVTPAPPPAPFIRRQPVSTAAAAPGSVAATVPPATTRVSRLANTDYGYVLNELKRIAITGGGIVILLLILSRVIH